MSQSKQLIDGYSDNTDKVMNCYSVIIFGNHTRVVKYIDFEFIPGANGIKILKPKKLNFKYFYYDILYARTQSENRGYARHYSNLKHILLPIVNTDFQLKTLTILIIFLSC